MRTAPHPTFLAATLAVAASALLPPTPAPAATSARLGAAGDDRASDVIVDIDGNPFVLGTFTGSVDFDPGPGLAVRTSVGAGADLFLAAFSPTGSLLWLFTMPGEGDAEIQTTGLCFSSNGSEIYLTGALRGTARPSSDPGAAPLTSAAAAGGFSGFLIKVDPSGVAAPGGAPGLDWARLLGGTGEVIPRDVRCKVFGEPIVVGQFRGAAAFHQGAESPVTLNSTAGSHDGFIVKFTRFGGPYPDAIAVGGPGEDSIESLAYQGQGDQIHVVGAFDGTVDFDPSRAAERTFTAAGSGSDAFVATYTGADLAFRRAAPITCTGAAVARAIHYNNIGSATPEFWVGGDFEGTLQSGAMPAVTIPGGHAGCFVSRTTATPDGLGYHGDPLVMHTPGEATLTSLYADRSFSIAAGGSWSGAGQFGAGAGSPDRERLLAEGRDGFVWMADPDGHIAARRIGGAGDDELACLAAPARNTVPNPTTGTETFAVGTFHSELAMPGGGDVLSSLGGSDAFLVSGYLWPIPELRIELTAARDAVTLSYRAFRNHDYRLLESPDLAVWSPKAEWTRAAGTATLTVPFATVPGGRMCYRIEPLLP